MLCTAQLLVLLTQHDGEVILIDEEVCVDKSGRREVADGPDQLQGSVIHSRLLHCCALQRAAYPVGALQTLSQGLLDLTSTAG